jgi:hypothetical protein
VSLDPTPGWALKLREKKLGRKNAKNNLDTGKIRLRTKAPGFTVPSKGYRGLAKRSAMGGAHGRADGPPVR